MKICLFNAKYSPNLGDGLLSECLEMALVEQSTMPVIVESIDVAGRTEFNAGRASREMVLKVLQAMPGRLRHAVLRLPLRRALQRRWLPHYVKMLDGADALIIGGGNLFTDYDLNFPTKMAAAVSEAKARGIPILIYGVGVSGTWTDRAIELMAKAFRGARVPYVSVRDEPSKTHFDTLFSNMVGRKAEIVRDPGLLISRYVKASDARSYDIGLNIMSAVAIRYHSTLSFSDGKLLAWYVAVYNELIKRGYSVRIFTNGSPEDVIFAKKFMRLAKISETANGHILRPANPSQLASLISECRLVVAFRMHSLIAAHSYGVHMVALQWDKKVESFMQSVCQGNNLISVGDLSLDDIATKISLEIDSPYDEHAARRIPDEAFDNVLALARALGTAKA